MKCRAAPRSGVLLYDGECGLCRGAVKVLRAAGARDAFDYVPLQNASSIILAYSLDKKRLEQGLHLVTPQGKTLRGFYAVRRACWAAPLLWPVALLLSLPGMGWPGIIAYRIVAANRRVFSETCAGQ